MRHLNKGRKFGRIRGRRKSFVASLMHNLIIKERIQTTDSRAKEIKPKVEKLVTIGKKGNVAALRLLTSRLPKKSATKLYYQISPKYKNRSGGYLRITKLAKGRMRDAAPQVIIEFV
ncbi:MAG: 50S ribosomal protein L17 [Candidatus Colwellbacteria bacterium]|nr:50S ribosomal protein L17 [Candidatus Colwellbacteria bacterium]